MCDLILEYGMPTVSWYAELALRRRVSMSAIGSVIDMAVVAFLAVVSFLPACYPGRPRTPETIPSTPRRGRASSKDLRRLLFTSWTW